jgi:hypothetical protein
METGQHPRTSERKASHQRLGEMLIERGKLRRDQLEHALEVQHTTGGLIGSVLVELGLMTTNSRRSLPRPWASR